MTLMRLALPLVAWIRRFRFWKWSSGEHKVLMAENLVFLVVIAHVYDEIDIVAAHGGADEALAVAGGKAGHSLSMINVSWSIPASCAQRSR